MTLAISKEICNSIDEGHHVDLVCKSTIPVVWPHILPFIEKSLDKFTTAEELYNTCLYGEAKLWIFYKEKIDGFAITDCSSGVGLISFCGGRDMNHWFKNGLEAIEEDFRKHECKYYQIAGREGWKRMIDFDDETMLFTKRL